MVRDDDGVDGGADGQGRADEWRDPPLGGLGAGDLRDDHQPDEPDEAACKPAQVDLPEAGDEEAQDARPRLRREPSDEVLQGADTATTSP